ncbi:LysR family transcriptional regulator substrate-binding protein [Aneurinibacillus migulanus]|uniref:LysR family transcriptional regulator substrate-binding protein n=1 Tax=Aneurinibacillus migulanus TaxID=47500 RepID=UPI002E24EAD6|nr:LysR family transcriptional regulator substrate-binding protein [Aneurinibacillus migulanus]
MMIFQYLALFNMQLYISFNGSIIPLKKDKMLCILPDTHPLHQQDKIYFEQIKNEMFIMPKSNIDKDVRKILKNNNVTPEIQYEVEEDQAIIAMVQNNLGISILPEMILYRIPNNVCVINLEGDNYRSIGIAATSLKNISPAAGKFIEYVKLWLNVQE